MVSPEPECSFSFCETPTMRVQLLLKGIDFLVYFFLCSPTLVYYSRLCVQESYLVETLCRLLRV